MNSSTKIDPVICDALNETCPDDCVHSKPHVAISDQYDAGFGPCDKLKGVCFWRDDNPYCKCSYGWGMM